MSAQRKPIKIVDVIKTKSCYGSSSIFIVVDRMPEAIYTRSGNRFTSNDSGFYSFLSGTSKEGRAFGGRKFTIKLDDGSEFPCNGDIWDCCAPDDCEPVVTVGVATLERLERCYVFMSSKVSKQIIEEWLSNNTPSTHYYKYDRRYTVEWARKHLCSFGRQVCSKRARKLRRKGVYTWKGEGGKQYWSPRYEARIREINEMNSGATV